MLDWSKIDTVFLDMDGTLLDLHFDNHFWLKHLPKRYAEIHQLDQLTAEQQLIQQFNAIRGTLNWYCLDYWGKELNLNLPALKKEMSHLIQIRPFVLEFLQALQQSPRRVVLITNAHHKSIEIKFASTNLGQWLDRSISSHQFGHPKEEQQFWQQLMLAEPFDPQRTLFIDDTEAVLQSAQTFGIKYLITLRQPDSHQNIRADLTFPAIHHFNEIMPNK